jgi:hypothetical protein
MKKNLSSRRRTHFQKIRSKLSHDFFNSKCFRSDEKETEEQSSYNPLFLSLGEVLARKEYLDTLLVSNIKKPLFLVRTLIFTIDY